MNIKHFEIKYENILTENILLDQNSYWAVDEFQNLIFNNQIICKIEGCILNQKSINFLIFNKINSDLFLIVNRDDEEFENRNNAWIIDKNGKILKELYLGNNIWKVFVHSNKILLLNSYQCDDQESISFPNLVILDLEGRILSKIDLKLFEIEAICEVNENEIIVYGYYSNVFYKININDFSVQKYTVSQLNEFEPDDVKFGGITYSNGELILAIFDRWLEKEEDLNEMNLVFYKSVLEDELLFKPLDLKFPFKSYQGIYSPQNGVIICHVKEKWRNSIGYYKIEF